MQTAILIKIDIVCGEYEFRNIHIDEHCPSNNWIDIEKYVKKFIEEYYVGPWVLQDGKYFFDSGMICIKDWVWYEITSKAELKTLLKYL